MGLNTAQILTIPDRNNIKPENTTIQLDNFDKRTRVQFKNMLSQLYKVMYSNIGKKKDYYVQEYCRFALGEIFLETVDARKRYSEDVIISMINSVIADNSYDDVLTLIEAVIRYWDSKIAEICHDYYIPILYNNTNFLFEYVNAVFKREYVGYRFIDKYITPICDGTEVESIQESLFSKYDAVRGHLSKANRLLSDRQNPDYENSIKESISAVEALCAVVTNASGGEATLGKMLSNLETLGVVIHPAMKKAFNSLYGYTSDAKGIRHAGDIGGSEATFEEAKYMLVSCCAFVNYITASLAD